MRKILLLFLLLGVYGLISGQRIKVVGVNEGLSSRQSFNVKQDKRGFVWISTRFGADRFDGESVVKYPIDVLFGGISPLRTTKLILDRKDDLWLFTDRGVVYSYNQENDQFEMRWNVKDYVRDVYFDHNNDLWFVSRSYIGNIKNDSINVLKNSNLMGPEIKRIFDYSEHACLIVSSLDIYKLNTLTNAFEALIDVELIKQHNLLLETCFYDLAENVLWIGSMSKGLYKYAVDNQELTRIHDARLDYRPILAIEELDSAHIIVGTDGIGACVINKHSKEIESVYSKTGSSKRRISSNAVYDIYIDADERVWLSTFSDGINILDFKQQPFEKLVVEEMEEQLMCSDILEDADNKLWVATENGIRKQAGENGSWVQILEAENVLHLFEDSKGNVWAGTYSSGAFKLDKNGRILDHFLRSPDDNNSIATNFVYTITEDARGNIWFGGKKGAIASYNPEKDTFVKVNITQANHITPFGKDDVLVSTESGVFQINIDNYHIKECAFNKNLVSSYISEVLLENDSIAWLATYGDGINRANLVNGQIQRINVQEGLTSNFIYAFVEFGNELWYSSENGIGRLDKRTFSSVSFTPNDGVVGTTFRALSKEQTKDGTIYFGSYSGATHFKPSNIEVQKPSNAQLIIEEFHLFNRRVLASWTESPLLKSIDVSEQIELKHNQHSFSFKFVAIDFDVDKGRRYRWKLDGLNDEWIGPVADNMANYTNISPGSYTFHVQYLDRNNIVLDARQLKVIVNPPFWNTYPAYLLVFVFLLVLSYIVFRQLMANVRRQHTQEKINFFVNTAHDIRTPLTLISSPLMELKDEIPASEKASYLMDIISLNVEKLNRMFSQLLDFQKVYESDEELVVEEYDVNQYLKDKVTNWNPVVDQKHLSIELDLPVETIVGWFDREKMDKIIDNLLSNVIKYTQAGGHIVVQLSRVSDTWRISVSDDGIGISNSDKKKLFQQFYRARNAINSQEVGVGMGLFIIRKYVDLHQGIIGFNARENNGSEFFVQFKEGKKHFKLDEKVDIVTDLEDPFSEREMDLSDKGKLKILIADDDKGLSDYLKKSLSEAYIVEVADDGEEAWDIIPDFNPDILISDLQMPKLNGFELCKRVKSNFSTSHIPIIFLTVVSDEHKKETGYNLGVDDYIEKPFDIRYLKVKISNVLNNRKLLQRKFLGIDEVIIEMDNVHNTEFVNRAMKIIDDNIDNKDFSISEFCRELGLSKSVLYTKFKSLTGYTPNELLKIKRMKKAATLLSEKKYSINEIAYLLGFNEPSYFTTSFKKFYGKTPKQFMDNE